MSYNEANTCMRSFDEYYANDNNQTEGKRYFISPDTYISGKSVVEDLPSLPLVPYQASPYNPNNLTDYLKAFLGRPVCVSFSSGGEVTSRCGILASLGENFLVLQPEGSSALTVFSLHSLLSIDICG